MLPIENENKTPKHKHDSNHHRHNHHLHHHNHPHEKQNDDQEVSQLTEKWSSLLKLQTIVITKPKKEKKRRSTFSFFGSENKIQPIDDPSELKNHPIGDAMIPINNEENKNHTNDKKKNKKRRYSV